MPPPMVVADLKALRDLTPGSVGRRISPACAAEETFHERLRRETRTAHDVVDHAMSGFDLREPGAYGRFLLRHADALARLRLQMRAEDRPDVEEMARQIKADLRDLGVEHVAAASKPESLDSFGVAYVLRGSRMGARVLLPRIGPGLPTRYMGFLPALAWRDFLGALETQAARADEAGRHHIVASARKAFEAFEPAPEMST